MYFFLVFTDLRLSIHSTPQKLSNYKTNYQIIMEPELEPSELKISFSRNSSDAILGLPVFYCGKLKIPTPIDAHCSNHR